VQAAVVAGDEEELLLCLHEVVKPTEISKKKMNFNIKLSPSYL